MSLHFIIMQMVTTGIEPNPIAIIGVSISRIPDYSVVLVCTCIIRTLAPRPDKSRFFTHNKHNLHLSIRNVSIYCMIRLSICHYKNINLLTGETLWLGPLVIAGSNKNTNNIWCCQNRKWWKGLWKKNRSDFEIADETIDANRGF